MVPLDPPQWVSQNAPPPAGQSLGQVALVSPLSQTPLPHLLTAWQSPVAEQAVPAPQVPQLPLHPSLPHCLPLQAGTQAPQAPQLLHSPAHVASQAVPQQ